MKLFFSLALFVPLISFAQNARYDSLYSKGAITKQEYDLLAKPPAVDSEQIKQDRYLMLYRNGKLTTEEYFTLKHADDRNETSTPYSRKELKQNANNQTAGGIILEVLGVSLLTTCFVEYGLHGTNAVSLVTGIVGGVSFNVGIGVLIKAGETRRKAEHGK